MRVVALTFREVFVFLACFILHYIALDFHLQFFASFFFAPIALLTAFSGMMKMV